MGPEKRQVLGEIQRNWLLNALRNSRAPFKLVAIGGQMVSDAAIYENFAQFPEERAPYSMPLMNWTSVSRIPQWGSSQQRTVQNEITWRELVRDLTVSPLTSGSYDRR